MRNTGNVVIRDNPILSWDVYPTHTFSPLFMQFPSFRHICISADVARSTHIHSFYLYIFFSFPSLFYTNCKRRTKDFAKKNIFSKIKIWKEENRRFLKKNFMNQFSKFSHSIRLKQASYNIKPIYNIRNYKIV